MRAEALDEIADEYDDILCDPDELRTLPRVGPYVADATLCFALDEPLPILDRNVVRVYDRLFRDEFPDTESERREFADGVVPDDGREARQYNLTLIDFSVLVCMKRDPECETCPFRPNCAYVS
jgi:A/G-specific adenine glycosylase